MQPESLDRIYSKKVTIILNVNRRSVRNTIIHRLLLTVFLFCICFRMYAQDEMPSKLSRSDELKEIQKVQSKFFSSETVGGFSGVLLGLYATGKGTTSILGADYDWFEYLKSDVSKQQETGASRD
jgi:hypothetical protein